MDRRVVWKCCLGVAMLVSAMSAAQAGAPRLEEEEVNPSEVVFRDGKPFYYDGADYVKLTTRGHGEDIVYLRQVRYDDEFGYVDAQGKQAPSVAITRAPSSSGSYGLKYYGNGLYGKDYYNSSYNRDARRHYSGPGYYGACDWRGCKEVHYLVPVYDYYVR